MKRNVTGLLSKEIRSIDITLRLGIDFHLYVEKKDDNTYYVKNNETEFPNEFHQYDERLPEFAFQAAVDTYRNLLKSGEEEPGQFKGETLFTVRFTDGTISWHPFIKATRHLGWCDALMQYNDLLRSSQGDIWTPGNGRGFSQIRYAKLDINTLRKWFSDGYVWISEIYPVISCVFDDMDCWYESYTKVSENRSLRIFHSVWSGPVVNEISIDKEGRLVKTGGVPLLNLLKKNNIIIKHDYKPGWYDLGINGTQYCLNENTLHNLQKYLAEHDAES